MQTQSQRVSVLMVVHACWVLLSLITGWPPPSAPEFSYHRLRHTVASRVRSLLSIGSWSLSLSLKIALCTVLSVAFSLPFSHFWKSALSSSGAQYRVSQVAQRAADPVCVGRSCHRLCRALDLSLCVHSRYLSTVLWFCPGFVSFCELLFGWNKSTISVIVSKNSTVMALPRDSGFIWTEPRKGNMRGTF